MKQKAIQKLKAVLATLLISTSGIFAVLVFFEFGPALFGLPRLSRDEKDSLLNMAQIGPSGFELNCKPLFDKQYKNIVVLGGSSAWGYPEGPGEAFGAKLEALLNSDKSLGIYRVTNRAVPAKNSRYMRECAFRHAENMPDYFIIYEGHNDFINATLDQTELKIYLEDNQKIFNFLYSWLDKSRSASWLRLFANLDGSGGSKIPFERFTSNRDLIIRRFIGNLEKIAELARQNQKKIIILTVVSNLHNTQPFRSFHVPSINASLFFADGKKLFSDGQYEQALESFRKARDLDYQGWRAYTELNNAVRVFAEKNKDTVYLVDFEKILEEEAPLKEIGCNYFVKRIDYCDWIHPNQEAHRLMAQAIFDKMKVIVKQ